MEKTPSASEDESFALIMCDLSRAFDIISHDILSKLKHCGINGTALRTFECYLSGIMQVVSVEGASSDLRPLLHIP